MSLLDLQTRYMHFLLFSSLKQATGGGALYSGCSRHALVRPDTPQYYLYPLAFTIECVPIWNDKFYPPLGYEMQTATQKLWGQSSGLDLQQCDSCSSVPQLVAACTRCSGTLPPQEACWLCIGHKTYAPLPLEKGPGRCTDVAECLINQGQMHSREGGRNMTLSTEFSSLRLLSCSIGNAGKLAQHNLTQKNESTQVSIKQ